MEVASMKQATEKHPTIPVPTATPAEVRTYFRILLSQKYAIPEAEAEDLVKGWQYGAGAEVESFSIDTYRGIFGHEIGALPYYHHFPRPFDRFWYHLNMPSKSKEGKSEQQRAEETLARQAKEREEGVRSMFHEFPFIFTGLASIFSLSLYLVPYLEKGALEPEITVLYITSAFLVISTFPFVARLSDSVSGVRVAETVDLRESKGTVVGLALLSAFHTFVTALGYFKVQRNPPQAWLMWVNVWCCVVPGLCFFLAPAVKRKED